MKLFCQKININAIPAWIPVVVLLVALAGFADAVYLTVEHYSNVIPPCNIGGCETVLTSQYSQIIGIPVSLIGSVYYLFVSVFLLLYLDTRREIYLRIPFIMSILGLVASLWFVSLMIFVIKAFCPYCAVSATTSIIIFVLAYYSLLKSRYLSP
jgi:uncharacterized membrane protein